MSFENPAHPHGAQNASAKLKIVVVEDNDDSAEMLSSWLENVGYLVLVARDGPSGVSLIKQTRPDVVLCDISLPGMTGVQVCQEVVRDMPKAPVMVALTGWGAEDDRAQTADAGFRYHVVKPIDPDELVALLESISGRPASAAVAEP